MAATQVTKSPHATAKDRATADLTFAYDKSQIRHWLLHIPAAARGTEVIFVKHGITPLRMSDEDIIAQVADPVAAMMMEHVGAKPVPKKLFQTNHEKLKTDQNADYAVRFRDDSAAFFEEVQEERAAWIAKLGQISSET